MSDISSIPNTNDASNCRELKPHYCPNSFLRLFAPRRALSLRKGNVHAGSELLAQTKIFKAHLDCIGPIPRKAGESKGKHDKKFSLSVVEVCSRFVAVVAPLGIFCA